MKPTILFLASFLLLICANAQNYSFKIDNEKLRIEQIPSRDLRVTSKQNVKRIPQKSIPDRDTDIISIIDLGTAANAFTYWHKLSYLWADPELNTVINIHRRGGALDSMAYSGDLVYDISKNGGQTWEITNELYDAYYVGWEVIAARYPQACIFNPTDNVDPNEAYVSYFAPALYDIPNWEYAYGVGSVGDTSYHTQNMILQDERFYQNIPRGFDMSSDGNIFVIDKNVDWTSGSGEYRDSLIIIKGIWNVGLEDYSYERESLEAIMEDDLVGPVDYKVAFGNDGQTGYLVMLGNNGDAEQIEGMKNLYPIYMKTTDGGVSWGEPEFVQIDGPNGLEEIVYHHLTDELLIELFGEDPPPRDEISYTTAYDCDIAVDAYGDLHIAVVIGPSGLDPFSIVTAQGYLAAVDIFTTNGGENWDSEEMGRLRTFRGNFGDISQDNRIQITTTHDADKIFISWLDTDMEDMEENTRPNIWVRGFNLTNFCKTNDPEGSDAPTNVTMFSEGMWEAYFGTAPKYCFEFEPGEYTIPYVYVDMNPEDPYEEIQFKYIQNFMFTEEDFLPCPVGIEEQTSHLQPLKVLGNSPNPFSGETNIQIELYKTEDVKLIVHSITGQQLYETDFGILNQGVHNLSLQMSDKGSGFYFYTVIAGQYRYTGKMIVE